MLESGQNENNSNAHTRNDSLDSMPDSSEVSEADLEKLLEEEEQAALSRASSRIPKPTITTTTNIPAPRATVTHKTSMPLRLPSTIKNSNGFGMTKGDDIPPSPAPFTPTGDAQADLRQLETEVNRLKEIKVKAENEATSQRVLIVSLKTEAQLVRNVLKRREKELEDMKGKPHWFLSLCFGSLLGSLDGCLISAILPIPSHATCATCATMMTLYSISCTPFPPTHSSGMELGSNNS
jgi:hypothetical protein